MDILVLLLKVMLFGEAEWIFWRSPLAVGRTGFVAERIGERVMLIARGVLEFMRLVTIFEWRKWWSLPL